MRKTGLIICALFFLLGYSGKSFCQKTTAIEMENQICTKRFGGACAFAKQEHIFGIWERIGGSRPLKGVARHQVFAFTGEGKATEKKMSAPYHEMNKVTPDFIHTGKWTSYKFKDGLLSILSNGRVIPVMTFVFHQDVPLETAQKEMGSMGKPKANDLLLIFPGEMILIRKG